MSDFLILRGGLAVRASVIALGVSLENRGVTLAVTADGKLTAAPRARLTADDIAAIRQHKAALLALVSYKADDNAKQ